MNEELQNALQQFLLKMVDGIERAGEFAIDQIPDVIQQALIWFALKSGIGFAFGLILICVAFYCFKWATKNWWQRDNDGELLMRYKEKVGCEAAFYTCAIGFITLLLGLLALSLNLEWLQILVAPKWFIVSEMSKLI